MTLKIEVGKTYLDGAGNKVKILSTSALIIKGRGNYPVVGLRDYFYEGRGQEGQRLECYSSSGQYFSEEKGFTFKLDLVKEYKEPVTHRRDVIWYRYGGMNRLNACSREVGFKLAEEYTEVFRQTVEYTESP